MTQDTEQRWKTSNRVQQGKNRHNHMFTRLPSSPARHGELTKEKIGREACLLATSSPPIATFLIVWLKYALSFTTSLRASR